MPHFTQGAIGRGFVYVGLTAMVTVGLIVLVALVFDTWFNDPPVQILSTDKPFGEPLCPGEQYEAHNQVIVSRPMLLFSYWSVMDEGQNYNVNGTQVSNGPRLHPHASIFSQGIPWTVPHLQPGKYSRVLAFRGTDGRENSVFLSQKFEIGVNCDE